MDGPMERGQTLLRSGPKISGIILRHGNRHKQFVAPIKARAEPLCRVPKHYLFSAAWRPSDVLPSSPWGLTPASIVGWSGEGGGGIRRAVELEHPQAAVAPRCRF